MAVELATTQKGDRLGTARQYSADEAISHFLNNDLQFDVGANFGFNQATPDMGIAERF
jgi:hypothetical protein